MLTKLLKIEDLSPNSCFYAFRIFHIMPDNSKENFKRT